MKANGGNDEYNAKALLNIPHRYSEKKLNKPVVSSNQALIWDSLMMISENKNITGFGKLFNTI